jgi:hypothetical protein
MRITPLLPARDDPRVLLPGHERPLLLAFVLVVRASSTSLPALQSLDVLVHPVRPHLHPLFSSSPAPAPVDVHIPQRPAHAQEQLHQSPFRKAGVVHQVGVDHVLQVASLIVGEQDVDGLGGRVVALRRDGVVDAVDYVAAVGEELVGFHFLHGLGDGLGAEGAADLFQGQEFRGRRVLD